MVRFGKNLFIQELHRIAYNKAFKKFGLRLPNGQQVEWDSQYCLCIENYYYGN